MVIFTAMPVVERLMSSNLKLSNLKLQQVVLALVAKYLFDGIVQLGLVVFHG